MDIQKSKMLKKLAISFKLKTDKMRPGFTVYVYNHGIWEVEAEEASVKGV